MTNEMRSGYTFWNRVIILHAVRVDKQVVFLPILVPFLARVQLSQTSSFVSQNHLKGHLLSDSQFVFTFPFGSFEGR